MDEGTKNSLLIQVMRSRLGVEVSLGDERTVEESSSDSSEEDVMPGLLDEDRLSLLGVVDGFWDVESHLQRPRETDGRVSSDSKNRHEGEKRSSNLESSSESTHLGIRCDPLGWR